VVLTTKEKKKIGDVRKWVKKERRRYRLSAHPKFSIGVDGRTKNLICRYGIYEVIGYDVENDEPITKLKKKNKYTAVKLNDYENINVRTIYNQIVKDIEKANKKVYKTNNIDYWVDKYISSTIRNGRDISERTLKSDEEVLVNYQKWLKKNQPSYLDIYKHIEGGKKVLNQYLEEVSITKTKFNKPPSKNTISNKYRRVKGFFNWISESDNQFPYNMLKMKGWGQERNIEKLPPAVGIEDMKKLINWMDENRGNIYEKHFIPILRMLLITGCRIGEIVSMKIEDVDIKSKTWNFFMKGSWRTIKLDSETLWNDLDYWLFDKKGKVRSDKEYVFHLEYHRKGDKDGKGGGVKKNLLKHITGTGVAHKFKRVILTLGLNPKLTPHSCRRGFITYMLEKTDGNVPLIAQIVGHKSWEMVYRYNRARLPKERTTIDIGEVLRYE